MWLGLIKDHRCLVKFGHKSSPLKDDIRPSWRLTSEICSASSVKVTDLHSSDWNRWNTSWEAGSRQKKSPLTKHSDNYFSSVCWSAIVHSFFPRKQMPILLKWEPKVFGIDTVYQSRNIHPLSSVRRSANPCLRACQGPGLILEGFLWFQLLNFMSVCKKMEDSCQWRSICLCHFPPPPSPPLSLSTACCPGFFLLFPPPSPSLSLSLFNSQSLQTPQGM